MANFEQNAGRSRAHKIRFASIPPCVQLVALAAILSLGTSARGQNAYLQHNLVSDLAGQADHTDTNLVNPWGITASATSPFWVSDNHSGFSTLYNSTGGVLSLVVTIPPPAGGQPPAAPTGIIFNGDSKSFLVGTNQPARFIFATEDGTISGWNSGSNAVLQVDNSASGTVYKGLALASSGGSNFLYATDFHNGRIDVFDSSFKTVSMPGGFADSGIPAGFAPFGIQNVGGNLYVTYAKQDSDKHDDVGGAGNGYINVFSPTGQMLSRFSSQGPLNSPWGIAQAPAGFGQFSGALLIGNFGDGLINAFDATNGAALGHLNDTNGTPIAILGLWGLRFGNGGQGGDPFKLYFTAGIPGGGAVEDHGLFGSISVASTISLSVSGHTTNSLTLSWSGGTPPFLVQRKMSVTDTNWFDVMTTTNQTAVVARDASSSIYRLTDHATNTVAPFTVWMSGASEVPAVASSGNGSGTLTLIGNELSWNVSYSGLTSSAILAHIHGRASTSQNATVLFPIGNPTGTSGTLTGMQVLTVSQLDDVVDGMSYANVHTTTNQGGEIRGQVMPAD
jgi:uncharacterized protein (TIGR03118 family)